MTNPYFDPASGKWYPDTFAINPTTTSNPANVTIYYTVPPTPYKRVGNGTPLEDSLNELAGRLDEADARILRLAVAELHRIAEQANAAGDKVERLQKQIASISDDWEHLVEDMEQDLEDGDARRRDALVVLAQAEDSIDELTRQLRLVRTALTHSHWPEGTQ